MTLVKGGRPERYSGSKPYGRRRTAAPPTLERATGRIIPHVFHHDGQPIRYLWRAWLSACRRAATVTHANGVKEVVRPELLGRLPHDFRRTAVRNLVRAGVPGRAAMQLTEHKTRSVFDRYNIVNERDLRDGVSRLAALHGANTQARRRGTVGGQ